MPLLSRNAAHFISLFTFLLTSVSFVATAWPLTEASVLKQSAPPPGKEELQPAAQASQQHPAVGDLQTFEAKGVLLALNDSDRFAAADKKGKTVHSWETGEGKSYLIPAAEVPVFLVLLNAFDRLAFPEKRKDGRKVYDTSFETFWDHLREQNWSYDKDRFDVNQFGHPYEGATMFGLPRSAGVGFWPSALYANVGSFLWEMGGETTRPSVNDIITTGNAGALFGEALFRLANLVLEDQGPKPELWHELAAAAISPPNSFNRYAFGDRFKSVFPSNRPAILSRLSAGASANTHISDVKELPENHDADAIAAFSIEYGLPGKTGYTYRRPFDYFDFQIAGRARSEHVLQTVSVRGLLLGTAYEAGNDYRGIWGLYGSYDYLAPYLYRASSTALSLGTTAQYWAAPGVALRGSVLGGFGFGAAGTDTETASGRGYHYGGTPQGLLAVNLLLGDRAMVDLMARGYYVSNVGSDHSRGADAIVQASAGVTVRIAGRHAVGLQYTESVRGTHYDDEPHRTFSEGTVSLVYTYLNDTRFGAVDWRDSATP